MMEATEGFLFDIGRWTLNPPQADKCLLAAGELDVLCDRQDPCLK
jgi:hypothetical protein